MDGLDTRGNSEDLCDKQYLHFTAPHGELWCNPVWDLLLCWPPTKALETARERCPFIGGFDTTKFVEKKCGYNGRWEGQNGSLSGGESDHGWANYTTCMTPEMLRIHEKVYTNTQEGEMKMDIAEKTRTLEFVGLSISLVALLASLAIFCRFRSLRNTRTRIHKNLFVAMVVQVLIRLTLYIDIELLRRKVHSPQRGIGNTPFLCEASYVFLEYAKTAMFMWMFIEGLFLHNMVTVTVFQETSYYRIYRFVGWGCPVVITLIWAIVTALYYHPKSKFSRCWSGYNLSSYFWILEGPRFGVILLNFLFLLNIIRVLVVKLRQSHTSEIEKVLKAVRAAVVLLPLLGITNVLFMIEAPLDNVKKFALWSYSTHFLTSFQGLFIATLYCFLNGEVRLALDKTITVYLSLRGTDLQARRQSTYSGCQPYRITSERRSDYGSSCESSTSKNKSRAKTSPRAIEHATMPLNSATTTATTTTTTTTTTSTTTTSTTTTTTTTTTEQPASKPDYAITVETSIVQSRCIEYGVIRFEANSIKLK
ncbi:PREDICTED: PDF receptor-like [Polistes dominula]|uniref:PDF receptor-like n=1 Tax=Polistes dominula TaxID=743375 RepID=A0ABM1ITV1_POLDO|nr:PREDICTED: PDF receptor-like [Polistes dominula]XP_015183636.1 PREDICTED: PDF receptor-like [Polistes dominula]XP_015183637.1 PREDICTED: PDF receptor-like [Polistes dominula]XP_015183638.1 PREDICTED: PDF receptor-like [Polistes dominula]